MKHNFLEKKRNSCIELDIVRIIKCDDFLMSSLIVLQETLSTQIFIRFLGDDVTH